MRNSLKSIFILCAFVLAVLCAASANAVPVVQEWESWKTEAGISEEERAQRDAFVAKLYRENSVCRRVCTMLCGLKYLEFDINEKDSCLTSLPPALPDSLAWLVMTRAMRLRSIGDNSLPAGLERLEVTRSQLTALPDVLPAGLKRLDVRENQSDVTQPP